MANKKKILLDKDGNIVQREILIEGHGGVLGAEVMKKALELISTIKEEDDTVGVISTGYMSSGYIMCCYNCGFISEDSLEDLIDTIKEIVKIEVQKREGQDG